jgi:predicted nucleotidyltransferase component of viral defense system
LIDAQDVIELAGELSLDPATVEKDYVLGWLLAGISHHPELGPRWIFKGGTLPQEGLLRNVQVLGGSRLHDLDPGTDR